LQQQLQTDARKEKTMPRPTFIDLDGRRYAWRDLLQRRKEQLQAAAKAAQPALFELREDCRPATERTARGRFLEPSLFTFADREG
jgi:hypothetical protein